ncbi:MAG: flagellin lysine-N-methylase [Clostridia bacterium]|nr:flagellin lysine-N-methylase [Clostridia bacterium]
MKWLVPDYYPLFRCKADKCRHTCCAGWEIDIDPETRERYRAMTGPLGAELAAYIQDTGEGSAFILQGKEERCPFLRNDGLCRIILEKGPEALCQICTDHPRFRNFFSDREEMGLGMCCEAAAELILTRTERMRIMLTDDDDDDEQLTDEEEALLALRQQLMDIASDRTVSLREREERIAVSCALTERQCRTPDADFMKKLDVLDSAWPERLDMLAGKPADTDLKAFEIPLEQVLMNMLYRHLPGAVNDGDAQGRIGFCLMSLSLIRDLFLRAEEQTLQTLAGIVRQWSAEIEYSDENIERLIGYGYEDE